MKELDFLPPSYHEGLRRCQLKRRNLVMCVGLGVALSCLHALNLSRTHSAQAELASLRNGASSWRSAETQLRDLKAEAEGYRRQLKLLDRLEDAAPLDAAIGEATRLLSDSMALTTVEIDTGAKATTAAGNSQRPPAPNVTRARLVGVAATDVEVGIFLGRLSACPIFAEVTLSYSRDARSSGRRMREFEVKFTLRPVEAAS